MIAFKIHKTLSTILRATLIMSTFSLHANSQDLHSTALKKAAVFGSKIMQMKNGDYRLFNVRSSPIGIAGKPTGENKIIAPPVFKMSSSPEINFLDDRAITLNSIPDEFELDHNYPNPFNPTTSIKYALSTTAHVTLKIYNMLGQEVRTLVNEQQAAGYKQVVWDGKSQTGATVASGVYIYRLVAGDFVKSLKMTLVK